MQVRYLADMLELVVGRSKTFLKAKAPAADLETYILQMWTAKKTKDAAMRLASVDEVQTQLALSASAGEVQLGLPQLQQLGAIRTLTVDSPKNGTVSRLFAMPECIPLYEALLVLGCNDLTPSDLESLYIESLRRSEGVGRTLVLEQRIQAHLSNNESALTTKMAVFAMFLLLAGAVSEDTALVLKQRDSKEYQYQAEIVEYLNHVGARLYGPGFTGNPKKEFKVGSLMDDLERRGQLEKQFGSLFRWRRLGGGEAAELYYFDFTTGFDQPESLSYVLGTLLRRVYTGSSVEDFQFCVTDLITTFWFTSPIEYKTVLFKGEADNGYYEALQRITRRILDTLGDVDETDEDPSEAEEDWTVSAAQ